MHRDKIRHHRDLNVWQQSMDLVAEIYALTRSFPKDELYGLANQLRRASVSVPSNIAEGAARLSSNEFVHHLSISLGSLSEVETQILVAERLGYAKPAPEILTGIGKIRGMLKGLIAAIRKSDRAA